MLKGLHHTHHQNKEPEQHGLGEEQKEEVEVHEPEYYQRTGEPTPRFYDNYMKEDGPKKGLEMYKAMMRWRKEHDIDHILDKPYPKYWLIKDGTPHYLYGHTKTGAWVSYEMNGRIDPSKLTKAGIKAEDIEHHITWNQEFVREVLDGGVHKGYMVVMDMKGFSLWKATNWIFLTITRTYGETLSKYYSGVLERLVVVNPPLGTKAIYRILMGVLPGIFGHKVIIKSDPLALLEWIDPAELPVQYGGTNTTPLSESDAEKAIRAYLDRINATTKTI